MLGDHDSEIGTIVALAPAAEPPGSKYERLIARMRRTGPPLWVMPLPANIVLRNFGLALFVATVGINAGQPFVRTIADSGLSMLGFGAAVLLTTVLIVLLAGHYLMRIPYDDLLGVTSGATGNPAILVYSSQMAPTERPDVGYAMIFPSMTIFKVIAVRSWGFSRAPGERGIGPHQRRLPRSLQRMYIGPSR